jgi:hypothetical protein
MRTVRIVCCLALLAGVLVCGPDNAGAEVSNEARQACAPDAMRLCSEFIPDVAKVTACMHAKMSELSPPCRLIIVGGGDKAGTGTGGGRTGSRHRYRYCHHGHCR